MFILFERKKNIGINVILCAARSSTDFIYTLPEAMAGNWSHFNTRCQKAHSSPIKIHFLWNTVPL